MIRRVIATTLVRLYFEATYHLLLGSDAGRRFLRLAAPPGLPLAHGYLTREDLTALVEALDPSPGDRLLDLGCGFGEIALEVHRRTGAEVVGLDASARAIAAARGRASRAGFGSAVRFVVGDLTRPPEVGACAAYALDSLMFAPDPARAIRAISETLEGDGRVFATLILVGPGGAERLRRSLAAAGVRLEAIEDVSDALRRRGRRRRRVARALFGAGRADLRGRLAMAVVLAEEGLVGWLFDRGPAHRWRIVTIPARHRVIADTAGR